eukprot:CAMPEP_0119506918 /NCGR_PEP_ID=MMETSP1344-20130328/26976_1 /TAXON_ID=236787 /ORGANISM="Florenciella parvula, Strain CCMP2471" /LENGTH=537 /DNA_ID=CAMNT_0007543497 /DNA_START=179 /DNA_END=1788 /DNA_ORIENTATION=+
MANNQEYDEPHSRYITRRAIWCAFVPCLAFFCLGWDFGATTWSMYRIRKDGAEDNAVAWCEWIHNSGLLYGFIAAGSMLGGFIGVLVTFLSFTHTSRKRVIRVASLLLVLGSTLQASAGYLYYHSQTALMCLIFGRISYGLGLGAAMLTCPKYIGEVVPDALRGSLLSMQEFAVVAGVCMSYAVGYETSDFMGTRGWEWTFQAETIPALTILFGMAYLPESPRWILASGGSVETARAASEFIHPDFTRHEAEELQRVIHEESIAIESKKGHDEVSPIREIFDLFKGTSAWSARIALGLIFFQNMSGAIVVSYYITDILDETYSYDNRHLLSALVGIGCIKLIGNMVAVNVIDKVGRRSLLKMGFAAISLSMAVTTIAYILEEGDHWYTTYSMIMITMAAYEVGCGSVTWVLLGELFPMHVKDAALALSLAFGFAVNYLAMEIYAIQRTNMGLWAPFLGFAVISALGYWFVETHLPAGMDNGLRSIESFHRLNCLRDNPCLPPGSRNQSGPDGDGGLSRLAAEEEWEERSSERSPLMP